MLMGDIGFLSMLLKSSKIFHESMLYSILRSTMVIIIEFRKNKMRFDAYSKIDFITLVTTKKKKRDICVNDVLYFFNIAIL